MAFEITEEPGLIRLVLSGTVTDADLAGISEMADQIEAKYEFVPPRITDTRRVTGVQVAFAGISELAKHRRALRFPNSFRSAIVAQQDVLVGLARMFQALNDNPQITIEVFHDEDSALEWLMSGA